MKQKERVRIVSGDGIISTYNAYDVGGWTALTDDGLEPVMNEDISEYGLGDDTSFIIVNEHLDEKTGKWVDDKKVSRKKPNSRKKEPVKGPQFEEIDPEEIEEIRKLLEEKDKLFLKWAEKAYFDAESLETQENQVKSLDTPEKPVTNSKKKESRPFGGRKYGLDLRTGKFIRYKHYLK